MSSKYGETHDIFHNHHVQTKAKLDLLLSKNTEIEVNNDGVETKLDTLESSNQSILSKNTELDSAVDALSTKVTACDTGACVVSSSALPTGAATESSLSALNTKVTAVNTSACIVSSSALPTGASSESSLVSLSTKVTACDTGAVVISSSALPTGASSESNQNDIKTLITSTNSVLAGTLTVSSPAVTKSSSTPISSESIMASGIHLSGEINIDSAKHISVLGECDDTDSSHMVDLLVSDVSGGTFYPTSHSGYFMEGYTHMLIADIPYRYIKLQITNASASAQTFTLHLLQSN